MEGTIFIVTVQIGDKDVSTPVANGNFEADSDELVEIVDHFKAAKVEIVFPSDK